jgi:ACS family hexuronate transporter-like MFS transporter
MKTIKGLRWLVITLVALATIINYIDRSALAVMWPGIASELGMDKRDYANIITIFLVGYAVGQSLFGKLFDALGTRVGFLLSIVVWSGAIALHFVARSALSFSLFRAMLGVGEAGNWPGATKAIAEWFPVRERALGQGIFGAGASLGSVIAPPLVALLYAYMGWKTTFLLIGALGFIWIVPWLILYKSGPAGHPWIGAEERAYILSGQQRTEAYATTMCRRWASCCATARAGA